MAQYSYIVRILFANTLILLGVVWIILNVANIFTGGNLLGTSRFLHVVEGVMVGLTAVAVGLLLADQTREKR